MSAISGESRQLVLLPFLFSYRCRLLRWLRRSSGFLSRRASARRLACSRRRRRPYRRGGSRRRRRSDPRLHGWRFAISVHQCEPHLIADRVVAPDFGDVNVVVLAQPSGDVDHPARYVEMERGADLRKVRPLGQGFEMIDRFARFHFDDNLKAVAPVLRRENQVGIQRCGSRSYGGILLDSRVHASFVFAAKLCV